MRIIFGLLIGLVACRPSEPDKPWAGYCFTQSEKRSGWVQQEITCNYRPDSATHEWRIVKTLDAVNDTNPFEYHRRRYGR